MSKINILCILHCALHLCFYLMTVFFLFVISLVNKSLIFFYKPIGMSIDFSFLEYKLTPLKPHCVLF